MEKMPEMTQMGPGVFFPTNPDLANILGRADFDWDNFPVFDFCFPDFPCFISIQACHPKSHRDTFPENHKMHFCHTWPISGPHICLKLVIFRTCPKEKPAPRKKYVDEHGRVTQNPGVESPRDSWNIILTYLTYFRPSGLFKMHDFHIYPKGTPPSWKKCFENIHTCHPKSRRWILPESHEI